MSNQITLSAIVSGIRTTADGGWRVTFDVDNSQAQEILILSQLRDDLVHMEIGKPHIELTGLPEVKL